MSAGAMKPAIGPTSQEELCMIEIINRFRRDEEGAALVEYGLLVGLIAVICVVAVTTLGSEISDAFSTVASDLAAI
jgi:pilus assembly protein Flp/PilA